MAAKHSQYSSVDWNGYYKSRIK